MNYLRRVISIGESGRIDGEIGHPSGVIRISDGPGSLASWELAYLSNVLGLFKAQGTQGDYESKSQGRKTIRAKARHGRLTPLRPL